MTKAFILIIGIVNLTLLGSERSLAQSASANAQATATIVQPIAVDKTADMTFGNIAVSTTGGTVVIAPSGTLTATGGVTLPALSTGGAAAQFNVTGSGAYTYSVTLPSTDVQLTSQTGNNHMTISAFTSEPANTGTLSSGAQVLKVGTTLAVSPSQPPGTYTTDSNFIVQVAYN